MLGRFFAAILNWLKHVFSSCFPSLAREDVQETDPLLVADSLPPAAPAVPQEPALQQPAIPVNVQVALQVQQPEELSAEESARVIHDGMKNKNEFIEALSERKQKLAYQLLLNFVSQGITNINRSMIELRTLNGNANRLETSWHRVRADFAHGDYSAYSIIPTCNTLRESIERDQLTSAPRQFKLLDNITFYFNLCKNMLKLKLCIRENINKEKHPLPTQEQVENEQVRTASRMNNKILDMVNKFNSSWENEPSAPAPEKPTRRGRSRQ